VEFRGMTTLDKDLKHALTAAADVLEMNLDLIEVASDCLRVSGAATRDMPFGRILPMITQSIVHEGRGLIILIVQLSGNLYGCLLADGQEGTLTLFILDGAKLELAKRNILPVHWMRKTLYERLAPGLKTTYSKTFNDDLWTMFSRRGGDWMLEYIKDKNRQIALAGTGLAYEDEKELDQLHGLDGYPRD
jgi:hypothetical protein